MEISESSFETANRRARELKASFPAATAVTYDRRIARLVITLTSGLQISFALRDAQGFENAKPEDLVSPQISPSGLGIHFPKIDADIYIPALLGGFLGSKRWMAAQIGKAGGSSKSEAKSSAARENGKRGGRPRKSDKVSS